jgi:non-ribosomal peptide synthetase component F
VSWIACSLSCVELSNSAEELAGRLVSNDVRAGDIVALAASLSGRVVPALLACWSIGATPWLFDPDGPSSRLASMFGNARPTAVVVPPGVMVDHLVEVPRIALDETTPSHEPKQATGRIETATGHAYLLFTSGSTGEPKGVLMPMASLESPARWQADHQGPGAVPRCGSRSGWSA